jgi:hypothetical protein
MGPVLGCTVQTGAPILAHLRDEGAQSKHHVCNPHHSGHDNREGCSLSPKGPGPKAFKRNVRDAHFLKCFWVPNNVVKFDGKTNAIVWLEDYRLACRVSGRLMTYLSSSSSPFT